MLGASGGKARKPRIHISAKTPTIMRNNFRYLQHKIINLQLMELRFCKTSLSKTKGTVSCRFNSSKIHLRIIGINISFQSSCNFKIVHG